MPPDKFVVKDEAFDKSMADWSKRSKMHEDRIRALEQANTRMKRIHAVHGLWTAFTILVAMVVVWIYPTVRMGIVLAVVLFLIRWAGNFYIGTKYVNPEMKRIDAEFPAPPPPV
jgi:Flp pilus assembly protein TadB